MSNIVLSVFKTQCMLPLSPYYTACPEKTDSILAVTLTNLDNC